MNSIAGGYKNNYRPDIDGLRAVAVLSVLAFHTNPELLSGGYVGVDVFFVISGYLITSIIRKQISENTFSITNFYERRFRRLLPALFVVVLVTCLAGVLLLHPRDLVDLAQSALATSLFSSNVLFYFESGYFDGPAELKPLLHTWSLAVEEQFYLLFPILLLVHSRYSKIHFKYWALVLFALSFLLCVFGTGLNKIGSFYMLPTRAWELLGGGLIALYSLPAISSRFLREMLALTGVIFIGSSLALFDSETFFPGYSALVPVVGTMVLLYTGEGEHRRTLVARVLSIKPIVFVGLISYSLYLWHWPILVFSNYVSAARLDVLQIGLVVFVIFAVSVLSWRYVEVPFREKNVLPKKARLLQAAMLASILMGSFGSIMIAYGGFPERYDFASLNEAEDALEWEKWGNCQQNMEERLSVIDGLCRLGIPTGNPKFLFWGDSHARALAPAIHGSAVNKRASGYIATATGCPPLLGIERKGSKGCSGFNDGILNYLAENNDIEVVILSSRWNLISTQQWYKEEHGSPIVFVDTLKQNTLDSQLFEVGLRRTIRSIVELGKSVVIVSQVPEIGYDVPRIHFVSTALGFELNHRIAPTIDEFKVRSGAANSTIKILGKQFSALVLDPAEYLCADEICSASFSKNALYLDDDHLSTYGSKRISSMFDQAFPSNL